MILATVVLLVVGLLLLGARFGFLGPARPTADDVVRADLIESWKAAATGAGLGRSLMTPSGPTDLAPSVLRVHLGPPVVLVVRLLAGQVPGDVSDVSTRLAHALGAARLKVTPNGYGHVLITLLPTDPLPSRVELQPGPGIFLGVDEDGREVRIEIHRLGHVAVQGRTRHGKSTLLYGILGQLAAEPGLIIAGVDPSGLTLRPFQGTRHESWQCLGLSDLGRVELILSRLIAEMDRRIGAIPPGQDVVTGEPTVVVVLEEYQGLLRSLDAADPKLAKRIRLWVARLLCESSKAAFSVIMVAHRATATDLDGTVRAQATVRISFSQDSPDSVRLLHPEATTAAAESVVGAPPGVVLVSIPGQRTRRLRTPHTTYREYADSIR
ncbi:MAG: hypothetical protein AB7I38_18025 [Dehalococcoidia bacterium]